TRYKLWKTLVFHPPGRETARLAGLVEKDDVPVGIAQPRFAPHPRLVARSVLERDPAARKQLDALVEIVALEIDRCRGDDLLFGIDLHRKRSSPGCLEAGVAGVGAFDDLLEPEPAVEFHGALVIGTRDGHLVEPRPRADIQPHA